MICPVCETEVDSVRTTCQSCNFDFRPELDRTDIRLKIAPLLVAAVVVAVVAIVGLSTHYLREIGGAQTMAWLCGAPFILGCFSAIFGNDRAVWYVISIGMLAAIPFTSLAVLCGAPLYYSCGFIGFGFVRILQGMSRIS